jgi:O-antigen/teichoic acid export membrane protein
MLKDLAKSFFIYGISSSIARFIGIFLLPIYTRIFTPEENGVIDLISTVVAVISIFGMAQLESAVSRYYYAAKTDSQRSECISTAFWGVLGLSLLWALLTALSAKYISLTLFRTPRYSNIIMVASLMIVFSNVFAFLSVVMRYQKRPIVYSSAVIIQMLTAVCAAVWLVVFQKVGIIGVIQGQLAGFAVGTVVELFYLRFMLARVMSWNLLGRYFRYGLR